MASRASAFLQDGLIAGFIGGLTVIAVFFVFDALNGQPLHTPTVLNALIFEGAEAARTVEPEITRAVAFNAIHVVVWLLAGFAAAWVVTMIESYPAVWYLLFVAIAFLFGAFLWIEGAFGVPGLGRFQLATGGLLGAAAMSLYLWWRHPGVLSHLDDVYGS